MKPDIIKPRAWKAKEIDGYVAVYCKCGNVLYIKNIPSKARQYASIECPCGFQIQTIYKRTKNKSGDKYERRRT